MNDNRDAAIVVHGGGPSAVLNASLVGIVDASRASTKIRRLFGARFGAHGLLQNDWIDLGSIEPGMLERIRRAPGSVLGSSRRIFDRTHVAPVLERCQKQGIGTVFFTGGNGSMKTALLLHGTGAVTVIGVPKTVDNDLVGTDYCPGFGSAARFYAQAVRDIGADNRALPSPVTIVEVIGRNAGWVVGATALARSREDDAPHLIYFPECPPTLDRICRDVEQVYRKLGRVVVAVCEGLRDPDGNPFGADLDRAGNRQHELASNLGHSLARAVSAMTGLRVRSERPGLLGRSCSFAVSEADAQASYRCGYDAVLAVERGESGVMIGLKSTGDTVPVPLQTVAGHERSVPREWITPPGNDASSELIRYIAPLAGPIEALPVL
jgi:ATP-dependent phosphofructokinase / diphosphate-dependent phosphofructokinase